MEVVNHSPTLSRQDPAAPAPLIKTLTFTTLFPNARQPVHGIFVANRLEHLIATGQVETEILAPVPWFPFDHPRFGIYARFAAAPRVGQRFNRPVYHPRFLVIPKIGMVLAPLLLYLGTRRVVAEILRRGFDFDVIDAHYFYPDGVAAILLGREFGKPVTITARGTDINQITDYWLPRRMILWAARRAAAIVTVCQALKDRIVELGVAADHIRVLRNGVDLALFHPQDRTKLRAKWGLSGRVILSVGHLIPRKGHEIAIEALIGLPGAQLLIAGDGPERASLTRLCDRLGLGHRMRFLGQVAPAVLAELYAAADVLVLASSHEGWANVLLEAMACGTPVVASNVWGTPEVVAAPEAGLLVKERTGPAFAAALAKILDHPPDRAATRAYAERFSWDATTAGQIDMFTRIKARISAAPSAPR
jgi:glycosyltransferase involved in cell wall biosynthesis